MFLMLACAAAAFAQGPVKVIKQAQPEKALILEVSIPASRAAVWEAFTTSEGLSTWLTPGATVELKRGGEWTAHFPGGSTGGGTIVSFIPQEEVILSAMAPEQFPCSRRAHQGQISVHREWRRDHGAPDADRLEDGRGMGQSLRPSGRRECGVAGNAAAPIRQRPDRLGEGMGPAFKK